MIYKVITSLCMLALISCTTAAPVSDSRPDPVVMKHLETLYLLNLTRTMEANMNACFITLNQCKLAQKDNCWPPHEQCVINTMRQYKYLKEQLIKRWNRQ